jgi:hypothetical protein
MRRTCPFLLGALLIALICLGGGLHPLDQLLGPTSARIAGWLPFVLAPGQAAAPALQLTSRELAPIAAALCLLLGPLFHRSSWLSGALLFAAASGVALVGSAVASSAGTMALAPGALLAAVFLSHG